MSKFAEQNARVKRLLADVEQSRRDFTREVSSREKLLEIIHERLASAPLPDPLDRAIEAAWERLYADYREYRKQHGYPRKGGKNGRR